MDKESVEKFERIVEETIEGLLEIGMTRQEAIKEIERWILKYSNRKGLKI